MQKRVGPISGSPCKCRPGLFYAKEGLMHCKCVVTSPCTFLLLVNPSPHPRCEGCFSSSQPSASNTRKIIYQRGVHPHSMYYTKRPEMQAVCAYKSLLNLEAQLLYYILHGCMFAAVPLVLFCKLFGFSRILDTQQLILEYN